LERVLELDEETFSDVKGNAETLAGLMLELKCDFPHVGDTFVSHGIRFTVQAVKGHRVEKIKVVLNE
ncbi:MAG: transporter associated domain-containing protein, partial [Alistipes sp.]